MAEAEALRSKIGDTIRKGIVDQGKAVQSYGVLLSRLGSRTIKSPEFAREAIDLYIGAVSDTASAGFRVATDIVGAGAKAFGVATGESAKTIQSASAKAAGRAKVKTMKTARRRQKPKPLAATIAKP